MKKILLIMLLAMFAIMPPASAEIKRSFDQFANKLTVSSTKTIQVTDTLSVTGTATKMFSPKMHMPAMYLNFIVLDKDYYFFTPQAYYLVEGEPTGQQIKWNLRNHSLPDNKPLLYTTAMKAVYENDRMHNAIRSGKTMQFRLQFIDKSPMILPISKETLQEWAEVFAFDLDAEIKKLPK